MLKFIEWHGYLSLVILAHLLVSEVESALFYLIKVLLK